MNRSDRTLNLINAARAESEERFFETPAARSEDAAEYKAQPERKPNGAIQVTPGRKTPEFDDLLRDKDDKTIARAIAILADRLKYPGVALSSPDAVKQYLTLRLADLEHEVFTVLFLDAKNRLIHAEDMFRGTLTTTSVHPREIVKAALKHNAAAVILAHNHPSGLPAPSKAYRVLTRTLKAALALVDVRILDHVIAAGTATHSFAEHGQI